MKKLDFKKPEAKPATVIETTHADLVVKKPKKEKKKDEVLYKPPKAGEKVNTTKIVSVRFRMDELEKINKYLAENDVRFSELVRDLLREKGIL